MTVFKSSRPVYNALPRMAARVPMACSSFSSSRELTPPEAVTARPSMFASSRYTARFVPFSAPSRLMSV